MTVKSEKQSVSEAMFASDQRVTFLTTLPRKLALAEVARRNQLSMADVIRRIINDYAVEAFPEYSEIYTGQITKLYRKET